jgi:hypothetical protein
MNKSNKVGGQGKLLLVSMPFSTLDIPSIQLGHYTVISKINELLGFPQKIWQTLTSLYYDYTCINDRKGSRTLSWLDILRPWQQTGRDRISRPLLFYQDT